MNYYYVNSNAQDSNGEHEVHKEGCSWLPSPENRVFLGWLPNAQVALQKASEIYEHVDGCYYCCKEIHKE